MSEKMIITNGIEICTESFGNPSHHAVLLIMGAMASMIWWDEEFCQASPIEDVMLSDMIIEMSAVLLYMSLANVKDMADDSVGVLDAYGIDLAHVVGMSLGGMIAQIG